MALLFALALLLRVLIPAGYMPVVAGKTLTVAMCNGTGPVTISIPMSGSQEDKEHKSAADHPCAFSAHGLDGLAAADPLLLAAAILFGFILALFALPLPPLRRDNHLRPPLRGPPASA